MSERALSVTEVVQLARSALERIRVTVVGEVTDLSDKPGYKAVYFSLCDGDSTLPCLMWKSDHRAEGADITAGARVEAEGFLTVYAAKGRLQFQVKRLSLAGEGVLRMQVAALVRKLQTEGLTADERKRPLPVLPERVGLVTSPRGKAVHDVVRTLHRRYPMGEIVFAGVQVEGRDAPAALISGLEAVVAEGVDVVVVCRGGGSYEDLMPFNDEGLARAVAGCPVPVVTGIGHEPDTSVTDVVADAQASTPTAAAEAVAPSREEIAAGLRHVSIGLARGLDAAATKAEHECEMLAARPVFRDAFALLGPRAQRIDAAADALSRALPASVERSRARADAAAQGLRSAGPRILERAGSRTDALEGRVCDLSPLAILSRGYAICYADDEQVVRSAAGLAEGDRLRIRFAAGRAGATVDSVETED